MDYDLHAEGPWDLVVLSDTMCYLGWLYSFFDVSWFASQLFAATRVGGHCLFANCHGRVWGYADVAVAHPHLPEFIAQRRLSP